MHETERSVLHVLPHPGGGGERYVDVLRAIGYRFDRVYLAHSPSSSLRGLARGLARSTRRAWNHDLLHVHGEVAAGLCLPILALRPSVVTLHGLHLVRRLRGGRRKAAASSLRAVVRAADRTICVSEAEHAELEAVVGPNAARRSVVVRNGVRVPAPPDRTTRQAVRQELRVTDAEPLGIWVGSLDERKDPLTAVRGAERASVALLVVGDGPLRSAVERAAHTSARVLGERHDVPRLLAAADVYLLTSHREGLAFSLLEAMAHGLPSVVTSLPENLEAAGETGLAVPADDPHAVAAALRRLADHEDERAALGAEARRRVVELFDAAEMVAGTAAVYEEVLRRRVAPRTPAADQPR